jgi:putative two-component system response regulator
LGKGLARIRRFRLCQATQIALRIGALYGAFAVLWVCNSDRILQNLVPAAIRPDTLKFPKDLVFVSVTTLLLLVAVRQFLGPLIKTKAILRQTERDIVNRLGMAAESRDDETGYHVARVGRYCAAIGRALELPHSACSLLELAGAMHDVGKIGIPDRVMHKKGQLEDEERQVMQRHTLIGGSILGGSQTPLLQMAERIAMTHHEWWDGSGYPNGLAGDRIPLEGRICAIADVFDALTTERPYKPAWSVEEAVNEIVRLSGKQFDPDLVKVFLSIIPEIVAIREIYQDRDEPISLLLKAA